MELTWEDKMKAKYFEVWAEKMRPKYQAEYEAKGREEGARQLLLSLLRQRFGPLPEEARRRVESIGSFERLQQLAEQILVVHSLEELELA